MANSREYDEIDGTFEGTWSGQIREGHFTGKLVSKGTGDLERQIIKGWINEALVENIPLGPSCDPVWIWGAVNNG